MPTYQYSCTECGHFFEQFQSFSEQSLTVCPECEGRLRKVFNAVGVVFKGSGFYRTDSRTGSSTDSGTDSGSSDKGGDKIGSSTSDAGSAPAAGSSNKGSSSSGASTSSTSTSAA